MSYHLYSRKHGDPERDYNFFVLEPKYFSQGNGNYCDVYKIEEMTISFMKMLKTLTLNILVIQFNQTVITHFRLKELSFIYKGNNQEYKSKLPKLFTPGEAVELLLGKGLSNDEAYLELREILSNSHYEYIINYGEGFWQDHFTYVLDLIENYLRIYPDKEKELLFDDKTYKFFQSPVKVKPRAEKSYLMPDGKIRQHEALWWVEGVDKWASHNQKPLEVN